MKNPLISIIIPTFQRSELIIETLNSVQNQSYKNFECLIIDDGSSSNHIEIIQNQIYNDNRFKLIKRPNEYKKGASSCRNYGFMKSQGEYINWLDDDDLFALNKLENQVHFINNNNKVDLITCTWARFKHSNSFKLRDTSCFEELHSGLEYMKVYGKHKTFLPSHNFMVKRKIVLKSGLWNEALSVNQDGEFFCRILLNSINVFHTADTYVLYRTPTNQNISGSGDIKKAKSAVYSWKLITKHLNSNIQDPLIKKYLENSKTYIFNKFVLKYRYLLATNIFFFKTQISFKLVKKFKSILTTIYITKA